MKPLYFFSCILLLTLGLQPAAAADSTIVKSPDGSVVFTLFQQNAQLHFVVTYKGQTVLVPSPMEFSVNGTSLTRGSKIDKMERYTKKENYPVQGTHAVAVNHFNGAVVYVTSGSGALHATVDVRVFNDGAAFRHTVSSQMPALTPAETTVFNIPSNSDVWYHDMNMHYESVHVKKKVEDIQKGEWLAPPATFKTPQGVYAAITEAALLRYPGMSLEANGSKGAVLRLAHEQPTSYPYKLRYSPEDTARLKQPAIVQGGEVMTPWRVVIVGKDLNALVNNDIVTNLNPAPDATLFPKGLTTDWIKPGRAVWKCGIL